MDVGRILDLKTSHPVHYWIRILCFVFSMVFIGMWISGDVDADTPAHDEQEIQAGSNSMGVQSQVGDFVRQMNGTLWVFSTWRNPADTTDRYLYGYFSVDNGTNWNRITIVHSDDAGYEPGGYPNGLFNVVALTNNSIIICLKDYDYWGSSNKNEITFLCHWNNSDLSQWERVNGYSSGTRSVLDGHMNVNETDGIAYYFRPYSLTQVTAYTFNPATRATTFLFNTAGKYPQGSFEQVYVHWNGTDWNFFVPWIFIVYGYDSTGSQIWTVPLGTDYYLYDVVLSANGTYGFSKVYKSGSYIYHYPYIVFRNATGDILSRRLSTDAKWSSIKLGLSNYADDYFTAGAFNYDTARFGFWARTYWKTDEEWQASHVDCFQEDFAVIGTFHYDWPVEMPNALYPIDPATGNHTQLPANLGGPSWCFWEYDDGDGMWDLWADYETEWPGVLGWTYEPPSPPEDPEGPGGDDDEGDNWLWYDGACISSAMIIAVILLVFIIIVQMTTRR